MAIAKLSSDEIIPNNLVLLTMDHNAIDTGGARTILERFAKNPNTRLEIKLDGNPFNYGKLAFNPARRKAQADMEREDMRCAATQQLTEAQPSNDSLQLLEEVRKLREAKGIPVETTGHCVNNANAANAANELERAMDRISNLERKAFGSTGVGEGGKGATSNSNGVKSAPDNSQGRLLGRAKSARDLERYVNDANGSIVSGPFNSPAKKSSPRLGASHGTPVANRSPHQYHHSQQSTRCRHRHQ
jgi:hypothetical protein